MSTLKPASQVQRIRLAQQAFRHATNALDGELSPEHRAFAQALRRCAIDTISNLILTGDARPELHS